VLLCSFFYNGQERTQYSHEFCIIFRHFLVECSGDYLQATGKVVKTITFFQQKQLLETHQSDTWTPEALLGLRPSTRRRGNSAQWLYDVWVNCVQFTLDFFTIFHCGNNVSTAVADGRAFRTSESESADFSEVRVRKFRTLKTLRTRTQRVC
jgi:hypothetical protein